MEIVKIVQDGIELDVGGSVDASSITQDADNRLVTDTEKNTWNNKQDKLTAGTNVTITGTTISAKDTTYNVATTTTNGLMSSADKTKLNGVEAGSQKNTITSVQGRTGAVTISKSDVGLGNVNNVAITAAQVTKLDELNYTRAMTQATYDALSQAEKNRTDVWYGTYKE